MQRYRAEHPEQAILYLDSGRSFPLKTQETDVVVPRMAEAYQYLGLDVLNAGEQDLDAGFSIYQAIGRGYGFQSVSANLQSIDTGEPALPPYTVITPRVGSGRAAAPRVAVVGLTKAGRYRVIDGIGRQKLHFGDPLQVADKVLPKARQEGDLLVVLGQFGVSVARVLAEKHPEIDLIIASDEHQYDPLDMVHAEVPILMTGIQGKYAIRLDLFRQSGKRPWRADVNMTQLGAEIEPDQGALQFMQGFQAELDDRTRLRAQAHREDPSLPDYVGSQACASCHPEAARVWQTTRHALAWEPIASSQNTLNPLCLQCHTSGYLKPNGFYIQTSQPHLTAVGCEACHGAGGNHVKDPFRARVMRSGEETCRGCHTTGQSPDFNFAAFWEKIRH